MIMNKLKLYRRYKVVGTDDPRKTVNDFCSNRFLRKFIDKDSLEFPCASSIDIFKINEYMGHRLFSPDILHHEMPAKLNKFLRHAIRNNDLKPENKIFLKMLGRSK